MGWVRSVAVQCATDGLFRRGDIFSHLAENAGVRARLGLERYVSGGLKEVVDGLFQQGVNFILGAGLLTASFPNLTFHISETGQAFEVRCGGVVRRLDLSPWSLCTLLGFIDDAVPKVESMAELELRRWDMERLILSVTLQRQLEAAGLACQVDITGRHFWVKIGLDGIMAAEYRVAIFPQAIDEFIGNINRILDASLFLSSCFGDGFRIIG